MSKYDRKIADSVKDILTADTSGFAYAWKLAKKVSSDFDSATTNAHGDQSGTGNPYTLFTVTGNVMMHVFGIVNTSLTGATATVSVGVTGNTAALIALETATEMDAGGIYVSATQAVGAARLGGQPFIVADGLDVIETVGTEDITAGQIDYYCLWIPLDAESSVVSA